MNSTHALRTTAALVLAACALQPALSHAQADSNYPARPVRIIVPQSPGASTDITARVVAQKLTEALGQTFVVDNRVGAAGLIGSEIVARAAPDGYTLMVIASSFTINPSLRKSLPYDTLRDFTPVAQLSKFPNMLAAHPGMPAKSLQDVIAMAKAKPGEINYASAGAGTGTHMSMEQLKQMTGINLVHIPYKGGGPAAIAVIGGQVPLIIGTTVGLLPHVRSGRLKAIAVTSAKRAEAAPEVPTFSETVPGYEHEPWNGMFAPAKMPRLVLAKLNAAVARVLHAPDVQKSFASEGATAVGDTPEQFAAIVRSETAKWAKVIKAAGIQPE
jgi:tripartite-type tricarboxylate transporter receptor subunit TctC